MAFYLQYIPSWFQLFKSKWHWRGPQKAGEKVLYLTFDDGPIPGVTPWVLDTLDQYQAKATFFCIGDNARKHPEILIDIKSRGHAIGNHTYHHWRASKHGHQDYINDVLKCEEEFQSNLFRPPYGRLKNKQARSLNQAAYHIIMWDVLTGDWDPQRSAKNCFEAIKKHARPGSIIVFHDSIKAWPRLKEVLPQCLEYYSKAGFRFEALKLQNTPTAE